MEKKKESPRGVTFAAEETVLGSVGENDGINTAVLECFKKYLPDESPKLLESKRSFNETSFTTVKWTKHIKEDPQEKENSLSKDIKELVTIICNHVNQRIEERINPSHPHHLMCFEILMWLIATLPSLENNRINGDVTDANRKKIEARTIYITALIGDRGIFSPDKEDDKNLIETLKEINGILLTKIIKKFLTNSTSPRTARKKTSPRPQQAEVPQVALKEFCTSISSLKKQSIDILEACSGFLFHLPSICTNLPKPEVVKLCQNDLRYQVFLNVRFGQLFQSLLLSEEFKILFTQSSGRLTDRRNPFLDNHYELRIPETLLTQLFLRPNTALTDFFQQNAGIHSLFLQNEGALKLMLKMLALLWELSRLVVACDTTSNLATIKNDLICFQPTQEQIRYLMDAFDSVVKSMKIGLKAIVSSITEIAAKLPKNKNQWTEDDTAWKANLLEMKNYYGQLASLLKELDSFTASVKNALADIPYSNNLDGQEIHEFRAYVETMFKIVDQTQTFCSKDKASAASSAPSPVPQKKTSQPERSAEKAPATLATVDSSKKESPRGNPPTNRPAPPTTSPTLVRRAEETPQPSTGNARPLSTSGAIDTSPTGTRRFSVLQQKARSGSVTEPTEGTSSPLAFLRKKSGPSPSTSPRASSAPSEKSAWPAPGNVPTVQGPQSPHSKTASPTTSPREQDGSLSSPKSAWPEPGSKVTTVPTSTPPSQSPRKTSPVTSPRDPEAPNSPTMQPTIPPKPQSPQTRRLSFLKKPESSKPRSASVTDTRNASDSDQLSRKKESPRKDETASQTLWPAEGHVAVPQTSQNNGIKQPSPSTSPRETGWTATGSAQVVTKQGSEVKKATSSTSPRESTQVVEQAQGTATQPKPADPPSSTQPVVGIKKEVSRSSVRDRASTWGKEPPKNVSESVWKEPVSTEKTTQNSQQTAAVLATSPKLTRQAPQSVAPIAPKATTSTATKQAAPQQPAAKTVSLPATTAPTHSLKSEQVNKATKEPDDDDIIIITKERTDLSGHKLAEPEDKTLANKTPAPLEQQQKLEPRPPIQPEHTSVSTPSTSKTSVESISTKESTPESTSLRTTTTSSTLTLETTGQSTPKEEHSDPAPVTLVDEAVKPATPLEPEIIQSSPRSDDSKLGTSESSSEPTRDSSGYVDPAPTDETAAKPGARRGGLQRSSERLGSLRFKTPPKPPAAKVTEDSRPRSSTTGTPPRPTTPPLSRTSVRVEANTDKAISANKEGTPIKGGSQSPITSPRTSQTGTGTKPVSPPLSPNTIAKLGKHRKTNSPRPSAQSVFEGRAPSTETSPRADANSTTQTPQSGTAATHEEYQLIAETLAQVTAVQPASKNTHNGTAQLPQDDPLTAIILEAEALQASEAQSKLTQTHSSSPAFFEGSRESSGSKRATIVLSDEQVQELTEGLAFFNPSPTSSSRQSTTAPEDELHNGSKPAATSAPQEEQKKVSNSTLEGDTTAALEQGTPSSSSTGENLEAKKTPSPTVARLVVNPDYAGRGPVKVIQDHLQRNSQRTSGATSPRASSRFATLSPPTSPRRGSISRKEQFTRLRKTLSTSQNTLRRHVDVLDQTSEDPNWIFVDQSNMSSGVVITTVGEVGEPDQFSERRKLAQLREGEARQVVTKDNIIQIVMQQLHRNPELLQFHEKNLEGICVKLLCDFILSDYLLCWDKSLKNDPKNAEEGKIYITPKGDYYVRTPKGSVVKGSLSGIKGLKFWGDYHFSFSEDPQEKQFDVNCFDLKPHVLKCAAEMEHIRIPTPLGILKLSSNPNLFLPTECVVNLTSVNGKAKIKEFPAATALSLLLQKDRSLRTLSLADCNLFNSDEENMSFRTFTSGLRDNESIELLDLSRCSLTNEASVMLNRALIEHPKITALLLSGNPFDNNPFGKGLTAGNELLELVTTNKNIVFIDVQETNLPADIIQKIENQALANGLAQEQTKHTGNTESLGM